MSDSIPSITDLLARIDAASPEAIPLSSTELAVLRAWLSRRVKFSVHQRAHQGDREAMRITAQREQVQFNVRVTEELLAAPSQSDEPCPEDRSPEALQANMVSEPESNPFCTLHRVLHELFWLAASARSGEQVFDRINPTTDLWDDAERQARTRSQGSDIPFTVFDPVLRDARKTMRELVQVAAGNQSIPFSTVNSRFHLLEERLQELADSILHVNVSPAVAATSPAASEGGPGKSSGRRRWKQEQVDIAVDEWLKKNARLNPAMVTRDGIADALLCSGSMVSKTPAWKTFAKERKERKRGVGREVQLTDEMLAVLPDESNVDRQAELDDLIGEQQADERREARQIVRKRGRR